MKHLFFYIILIFSLFNSAIAQAENYFSLPDDFDGKYTLRRMKAINNEEEYDSNIVETGYVYYELGKYFYEKYPNNEVFDDDFIDNIRGFFPFDDEEELRNKLSLLRTSIRAYRMFTAIYNKYIASKLAPRTYKKVHSYDDYDHKDEVQYVEAPDGYFNKVYNFKKFLSYSENVAERQAINKFEEEQSKKLSALDKLDYVLKKIELKKLFLYGTKYKNPLISELGTTPLMSGKSVDVRLLSRDIYIEDKKELDIGLDIHTNSNRFILANNLSSTLLKPQINLDDSDNVASYKVLYPTPLNTVSIPFAHKYFGDFLLPIKVVPQNPEEPIIIKGSARFYSCSLSFKCEEEFFPLEMQIDPNGDEFLSNGYDNYFGKTLSYLPPENSEKLSLDKFVIDHNKDGQSIRLELTKKENLESFKIFVEEKDGYTRFSAPLISIHDDKIYVRLNPLELDKNYNLVGSEFIVTAVLNNTESFRKTVMAEASSPFDINHPELNLGLIIIALLGGFILNFMPCVFPVLSLKILTLSQLKSRKKKQIRQSFIQTIYGIFAGFTIITVILLLAKYLGYSLGWGMQFQNISFLVVMTYILTCFITILPHIDFNGIYKYTINNNKSRLNFYVGGIIVLLSTPCTGPYMATAIGFALSGTYIDIIVMMYSVALGLSIPYFIAYLVDDPKTLLPENKKWLNKLQIIMKVMLYATIMWFLSLILGQTDWTCIFIILGSIITFAFLFKLYRMFQEYLNGIFDENITPEILQKARLLSTLLISILFIVLAGFNIHTARSSYFQNYDKNMAIRQTGIDNNLIDEKLSEGKSVLLEIGADWCMTCHFNNILVLNKKNLEHWKKLYNLELIKVDWTDYNQQTLEFMAKYGRKGLPFYILYTPIMRDGIVLPEIFNTVDIDNLLINVNSR